MPRSSRKISRSQARPSRSSDPARALRRPVPGLVSIRSGRTGGTAVSGRAGRSLPECSTAAPQRPQPLSPCVFASYPDAGVIQCVDLGVSGRAAENLDHEWRTSLSSNWIDRNPVHVPFASFRIAGRNSTQAGSLPGGLPAGPAASIVRLWTVPAPSRPAADRPSGRFHPSLAMRKTGASRARGC
jgi:hypothetical protein